MHQPHEDLPLDDLLCLFKGEYEGQAGFICWLTDRKTVIFIPAPTEEKEEEIWDDLMAALEGNADYIVYLDTIIRVSKLRYAEICTTGPEPTLIFHFENNFNFYKPYEQLALLEKHYAELMKILSGLQDHRAHTSIPKGIH